MKCFTNFSLFFIVVLTILLFPVKTHAIEDPLSVPNNKLGIHILFPDEIRDASVLINSKNGDWGYVVIPIQATDKNMGKWQKFMDDAKKLHMIPIIRIATEGDYFNKIVWRKPQFEDILDFANFLNALKWPTKNRYVIIFNEPNNYGEWGGEVNPSDYAQMLSYAVTIFKSTSQDFFVISAGLDNAASNQNGKSMNEYDFLLQMTNAVPGIFNQIDGFSSHAYPNPGFTSLPSSTSKMSIKSFKYEAGLIKNLSGKELPVFITETGWSNESLSENTIASYYKEAVENVWNSKEIVVLAPFLLKAGAGPFTKFSFFRPNNDLFEYAKFFLNLEKAQGKPTLAQEVLGKTSNEYKDLPMIKFTDKQQVRQLYISQGIKELFKWLLKID